MGVECGSKDSLRKTLASLDSAARFGIVVRSRKAPEKDML